MLNLDQWLFVTKILFFTPLLTNPTWPHPFLNNIIKNFTRTVSYCIETIQEHSQFNTTSTSHPHIWNKIVYESAQLYSPGVKMSTKNNSQQFLDASASLYPVLSVRNKQQTIWLDFPIIHHT